MRTEKQYVSVVFDRKHKSLTTGFGKVEILVTLSRTCKIYMTVKDCSVSEWKKFQKNEDLMKRVKFYNDTIITMSLNNEELSRDNFKSHVGLISDESQKIKDLEARKERARLMSSPTSFHDFFRAEVAKERLTPATISRRFTVLDSIIAFGKLNRFEDLTPANIREYDEYLHEDDKRQNQTIINYHKVTKKFITLAFQLEYISKNPYDSPLCHFSRGEYKERKPLTEEELQKVINLKISNQKEDRARDLFVFSAYTGLAYVDAQNFDFETMTEKKGNTYYIDGERIKTGHAFFTPILPPAMKVLEKYNFHLPKISNQKLNDYLHLVEAKAELNKPMTTHVARHSFATLVLSYDIPIENVARMMGHTNVKTTQIYAKILKKTIERHTEDLIERLAV